MFNVYIGHWSLEMNIIILTFVINAVIAVARVLCNHWRGHTAHCSFERMFNIFDWFNKVLQYLGKIGER